MNLSRISRTITRAAARYLLNYKEESAAEHARALAAANERADRLETLLKDQTKEYAAAWIEGWTHAKCRPESQGVECPYGSPHDGAIGAERTLNALNRARHGLPPIIGSYNTGIDTWVHGERNHEGRRFLGPCPMCGRRTVDHGNAWRCTDTDCEFQALTARPQPWWWNSAIAVVKDGNMWCANRASFVNLQESLCQFASTPGAAVAALLAAEKNLRDDARQ